jgi:uncharacterized protein (TIGR03437 family)
MGPAGYTFDSTPNGPSNPAPQGSVVSLFLTGAGETIPHGTTGGIYPMGTLDLPMPVLPVSVLLDGQAAPTTFVGGAPGSVEGILQINFEIPAGIRSGSLPVIVKVGAEPTQSGVTISVK